MPAKAGIPLLYKPLKWKEKLDPRVRGGDESGNVRKRSGRSTRNSEEWPRLTTSCYGCQASFGYIRRSSARRRIIFPYFNRANLFSQFRQSLLHPHEILNEAAIFRLLAVLFGDAEQERG